jgi:hypothetical protein
MPQHLREVRPLAAGFAAVAPGLALDPAVALDALGAGGFGGSGVVEEWDGA